MPPHRTRRTFLVDLGRSAAGLLVVGGLGACSQGGDPVVAPPGPTRTQAAATPEGPDGAIGTVDLGFVAAYVLARDGQATVVDTGVPGSAGAILAVLQDLGLGWADVGDVILTHGHGDHVGSLDEVATAAADAGLHAGAPDIAAMTAPRPIRPVAGGDRVGDLEVIATPGHTPGHISLLDLVTGTLFAGDALTGADGELAGPNAEFTPDMATALQSVGALAARDPNAIRVAHGFPVEAGAAQLRDLAAALGVER